MSPEDAFRRVLTARLPAGPGWTAWIDGTVAELAASAVTLTPEEVALVRRVASIALAYAPDVMAEITEPLAALAERLRGPVTA